MLKIRLQRVGRTHEPTFRVVLTDSKNGPKSGKFLEVLGSFDARHGAKKDKLNAERIKHWVKNGAQLSGTVHNFLVDQKVITGKKINKLPKKTPAATPVALEAAAPAPVAEATPAPTEAAPQA